MIQYIHTTNLQFLILDLLFISDFIYISRVGFVHFIFIFIISMSNKSNHNEDDSNDHCKSTIIKPTAKIVEDKKNKIRL